VNGAYIAEKLYRGGGGYDASGAQNVIWGMPWISNEAFPGLACCLGGRSLFGEAGLPR
jgi:hypothetical protein